MHFLSDNAAPAHPRILNALVEMNAAHAPPYGADGLTQEAEKALERLFDADVRAFLVSTGTAANALALAALVKPHGAVLVHEEAHVNVDECGAPEFFTAGAKLIPLPGSHGKLAPETIEAALARFHHGEHQVLPQAVSISNPTEMGCLYGPEEVQALAEVAHRHGLKLHMDGARLANAVAALDCEADALVRGVDVLSLGSSKGGTIHAEAVIFFDTALAVDFPRMRKRAGQLMAKMRYPAAQLLEWLKDDLWLDLAAHANAMARLLAARLDDFAAIELAAPVQTNMVFAWMPRRLQVALGEEGALFHVWREEEERVMVRLACSWMTAEEEIEALASAVALHGG